MRLIINNITFELQDKQRIAQTKQVNDILSLNTRQSNFTSTYNLPLTAKNVRGMASLGVVGNGSNIPYQRNNAYLYGNSGECFVYNGWVVVNETSSGYKINIYDGSIDFYKAIENTTLSQLDLTEINHFKTINNVIDSWEETSNYRYIIADYNGKALFDTDKINIDYLVPSVRVSWLFDLVMNTYGFTYSGTIFNTFNFTNLFMTFPKGLSAEENPTPESYYTNDAFTVNANGNDYYLPIIHTAPTPTNGSFISGNINYLIPADGTYVFNHDLDASVTFENQYGNLLYNVAYRVRISINNQPVATSVIINSSEDLYLSLTAGDLVSFIVEAVQQNGNIYDVVFNSGSINIGFLSGDQIDFNASFIDFKTKDFINEILWRFGLTPYLDKYSNNIEFLTLQEVLQTSEVNDWSSKYNSVNSEKYIYGSYAQENNLTYKYNDEQSDYHDGVITIDNVNIDDSKTVVASKIYAPEKDKSLVFEKETNIYKLWNKEIKDDGSVSYKSLDKRFYFLRSDEYFFETPTIIGSETLVSEQSINSAPFESFFKLPFSDIVSDYYLPIYQILNQSQLVNLTLFLDEKDIEDLDFKKLYYFRQLGNYYILNKVNNFTERGKTKCDFIRVKYSPLVPITNVTGTTINSYVGGCINYTSEFPTLFSHVYKSVDGGINYTYVDVFLDTNSDYQTCGYSFSIGNLIKFVNPFTGEDASNIFEVI